MSSQADELWTNLPRLDLQHEHRVKWAPPPLGRGARIEQPDALPLLDEREMGVTEDDGSAAGEPGQEALLLVRSVPHPNASSGHVDDALLRQELAQRRLVDVAEHRVYWRPKRLELLEEDDGRQIAGMKNQICRAQPLQTELGEPSGSPRKMRVRDHRDRSHGSGG